MVALHANGYRTLTSKPGHHQTTIQTLPETIGLPTQRMRLLDVLRKQRNLADYDGDTVPEKTVTECVEQAQELVANLKDWLTSNKPELL